MARAALFSAVLAIEPDADIDLQHALREG